MQGVNRVEGVTLATIRAGQRKKSIEEVVGYAVGHRIRVQVLTLLNEATYTPDQIARASWTSHSTGCLITSVNFTTQAQSS